MLPGIAPASPGRGAFDQPKSQIMSVIRAGHRSGESRDQTMSQSGIREPGRAKTAHDGTISLEMASSNSIPPSSISYRP